MWTDFDIFLAENVTDKVSNQKTLYYATSTYASALPGTMGKHQNVFFPQMLY